MSLNQVMFVSKLQPQKRVVSNDYILQLIEISEIMRKLWNDFIDTLTVIEIRSNEAAPIQFDWVSHFLVVTLS